MSFGQTTIGSIGLLATLFDRIGIELPPAVSQQLNRARRFENGEGFTRVRPGDFEHAVIASIDRGKDPAADKDVQRLDLARRIADLAGNPALRTIVEADLDAAVSATLGEVLSAMKAAFDAAAGALTSTLAELGPVDLDDHASILSRGNAVADHWRAATAARSRIEDIRTAWGVLSALPGFGTVSRERNVLVISAPSGGQWEQHQLWEPRDAWDLVVAGIDLTLAMRGEVEARNATLDSAAQQHLDQQWAEQGRNALKGSISETLVQQLNERERQGQHGAA